MRARDATGDDSRLAVECKSFVVWQSRREFLTFPRAITVFALAREWPVLLRDHAGQPAVARESELVRRAECRR